MVRRSTADKTKIDPGLPKDLRLELAGTMLKRLTISVVLLGFIFILSSILSRIGAQAPVAAPEPGDIDGTFL